MLGVTPRDSNFTEVGYSLKTVFKDLQMALMYSQD